MESKSFILVRPKHFTITESFSPDRPSFGQNWWENHNYQSENLNFFQCKTTNSWKDFNYFLFWNFKPAVGAVLAVFGVLSSLVTVSRGIKNLRDDEKWFQNSAILLKSWLMKHFHGYFVSKGSRPRDSVVFSLTPLIKRMAPRMFEKCPDRR